MRIEEVDYQGLRVMFTAKWMPSKSGLLLRAATSSFGIDVLSSKYRAVIEENSAYPPNEPCIDDFVRCFYCFVEEKKTCLKKVVIILHGSNI